MPTPSLGLHVFLATNKFLTIDNLFKHLKKRHDGSVIKNLNKILRLKTRLRIMESKILFFQKCIEDHVCPSHFTFSIKNAKLCPSLKIKKIFLENSINCLSRKIPLLECQLKTLWHQNVMTLSLFDRMHFLRLMSSVHKRSICKLTARRISKVAYLIKKRFVHIKKPYMDGVVFNLSTFRPTEFESLILGHGLDFCVPFHMPDCEKVFADIEVLY